MTDENSDEETNILQSESESENSDDLLTNQQNYSPFDVDDISDLVHEHGIKSSMVVEYEKVIDACGYGWFQRYLLLVCGWAFVSDSIEIQVVSFVVPAACDLEMTSSEKGWLNGIIFVGMMIGGYAFGGVGDIKGRRLVLICSLTINGTFGILSSFAPSFAWFIVLRWASGIGVGAALPVLFSYYAEFLSRDVRGPMIEMLASFLLLGNIMTAGGAWSIIPYKTFWFAGSSVRSWRIFVALFSLPALSSAFLFVFMPESPKFLVRMGRIEEAKKVFQRIWKTNHRQRKNLSPIIQNMSFYDEIGKNEVSISKVISSTLELFGKYRRKSTLPLITIWFTMSFAYYGLWMWLPEIYNRMESYQVSVCQAPPLKRNIIKPNSLSNSTFSTNSTKSFFTSCQIEESRITNDVVYLKTFLISVSNIPGAILTIFAINKVGRRNLLASSMSCSGLSVLFFLLVRNEVEMMSMSCIFSGLSVVSWNVLNVVTLENYPTHLRSTAFGLQTSIGRIASILGNVVFGVLVDVQCSVPLILVSISFIVGGIASFLVPKTDDVILS